MPTIYSPIVHILVGATRCQYCSVWACPQMNKFQQVSIDDHQMSVEGGIPGPISVGVSQVPCLGGSSYHMTYPMTHVMYLTPPTPKQNDRHL